MPMSEVDVVLKALANKRRRLAIYCLSEHRWLTLADLAEQVVEFEGVSVQEVSAKYTTEVYFSLYHTHVPKLVDAGLARYSQDQDLVSSTDDLEPLIHDAHDELSGLV